MYEQLLLAFWGFMVCVLLVAMLVSDIRAAWREAEQRRLIDVTDFTFAYVNIMSASAYSNRLRSRKHEQAARRWIESDEPAASYWRKR